MCRTANLVVFVMVILVACAQKPGDKGATREAAPAGTPPAGAPAGESPGGSTESAGSVGSVADPVKALDSRIQTLETTSGNADMRGTMCRYRAYWEQGAVVMIEEEADLGGGNARSARYYYDPSGHLFHYSEGTDLAMSFDASGAMTKGVKTAGGMPVEIEPFEINAAQMRGRELRTAVAMNTRH